MEEPGLDGRHRNEDGRIREKNSNTRVDTLRDTYGSGFAPGFSPDSTLGDVLGKTGANSLSDYLKNQK